MYTQKYAHAYKTRVYTDTILPCPTSQDATHQMVHLLINPSTAKVCHVLQSVVAAPHQLTSHCLCREEEEEVMCSACGWLHPYWDQTLST